MRRRYLANWPGQRCRVAGTAATCSPYASESSVPSWTCRLPTPAIYRVFDLSSHGLSHQHCAALRLSQQCTALYATVVIDTSPERWTMCDAAEVIRATMRGAVWEGNDDNDSGGITCGKSTSHMFIMMRRKGGAMPPRLRLPSWFLSTIPSSALLGETRPCLPSHHTTRQSALYSYISTPLLSTSPRAIITSHENGVPHRSELVEAVV